MSPDGSATLSTEPERHAPLPNPHGPAPGPAHRVQTVSARVLIADDHPVVLFALENLISRFPHLTVVGRARTFAELFEEAAQRDFDVAITDLYMPSADGYDVRETLTSFRQRHTNTVLVVLTAETDSMALRRLLDLPIDGILSKKDRVDLIPVAIVAAMARERYVGPAVRDLLARDLHAAELARTDQRLSAREHEVLALYASGLSVTEIAGRLGRSIKTISAQKCSAMKKLSLSNDIELFRFATGYGIGLGVSL